MDNKYGIVLPKDSPTTTNYNKFKDQFGEDGNILVIAIQTDSLYTEKQLKKWKQLGDSILKYKGVESVLSEASPTLQILKNNKEEKKFEVDVAFPDTTFKERVLMPSKKFEVIHFTEDFFLVKRGDVSVMMIGIDEAYLSDRETNQK